MNLVDKLIAIEQIKLCKARYCYAVDTKDWSGFGAVFMDDAIWDESEFPIVKNPATGQWVKTTDHDLPFLEALARMIDSPVVGSDAIRVAAQAAAGAVRSFHRVYSPHIEFVSSTRAKAVWPMEDMIRFPDNSPIRTMRGMGHYHETYSPCPDGRWLIATSKVTRLWLDID